VIKHKTAETKKPHGGASLLNAKPLLAHFTLMVLTFLVFAFGFGEHNF
jgi:hypothetical protein